MSVLITVEVPVCVCVCVHLVEQPIKQKHNTLTVTVSQQSAAPPPSIHLFIFTCILEAKHLHCELNPAELTVPQGLLQSCSMLHFNINKPPPHHLWTANPVIIISNTTASMWHWRLSAHLMELQHKRRLLWEQKRSLFWFYYLCQRDDKVRLCVFVGC